MVERKWKMVKVSGEWFRNLFTKGEKNGYRVIEDPVPTDAEVVFASWDVDRGIISVVFEHPSFELVKMSVFEGGYNDIPVITPVCQDTRYLLSYIPPYLENIESL